MSLPTEQVAAVVLAGGFGTRIQHLLPNLPKPMAPVNGRPFLEWVVRYLANQGVRRVVLSTGYLAETVEQHFKPQPVKGTLVKCVVEAAPLGTAGGFCHAVTASGEPASAWLVLNGDSLALAPLGEMFQSLSEADVQGALLGVSVPDASRYGTIQINSSGDLVAFNEKRSGSGIINAGVYLFRAGAINSFPSRLPLSFEKEVFPELIAGRARIKVCVTQVPFLDIGTPGSLPLAEEFIQSHAAFFEV